MFRLLDWDSDFFGYTVASVDVREARTMGLTATLERLRVAGVKLAYSFVNPSDVIGNKLFEDAGALLADEKVTFRRRVHFEEASLTTHKAIQSCFQKKMTPGLLSLALESGVSSRFKVDPNFKNGEFEKLYTAWMENSLLGLIADEVFVYFKNGEEAGLVTLRKKGEGASIGLVAVDSRFRRLGIAQELIRAAVRRCAVWNLPWLEVATQRTNTPACRLYDGAGFALNRIENVYHLWT